MEIFGIKITRVGLLITAIIVALLMTHPTLRYIVWLILPLGSGWDDIIGGGALLLIAILVFVEVWSKRYPNNPYNH